MIEKEQKKFKNQQFDSIHLIFDSEKQELDPFNISKFVTFIIDLTKHEQKMGMDLIDMDFSHVCKFIRNSFKVSQKQMAAKLNINVRNYQHLEYGRFTPNWRQAFNLYILYIHAQIELVKNSQVEQEAA